MKALTFIVTDKCNITCDFCAPGCGPQVRGHLTAEFMARVYDAFSARERVPLVVFSGGEPFLYRDEVLAAVRHVRSRSEAPVRVVSNGYWGTTVDKARAVIEPFARAGLTELDLSVDDFHEEYIPLEVIRNAVTAALDVGLPVLLAHKSHPGSRSDRATFEALLHRAIPDVRELPPAWWTVADLVFSTGSTIPVGRGEERVDPVAWAGDDVPESDWKGPCGEALANFTVLPTGQLAPCCGLVDRRLEAFHAGDLSARPPGEVLAHARASVLYNWLALEGPSGIMEHLARKDPSVTFAGRYVLNCQLCQEIFADPRKTALVADSIAEVAEPLGTRRCAQDALESALFDREVGALVRRVVRPGT